MKKLKFIVFFLFISNSIFSQNYTISEVRGGSYEFERSSCLHQEDREWMLEETQRNIQLLQAANKLSFSNTKAQVAFGLPLKMADGLNYNSVHAVSNFYDHNTNGNIGDYSCGERTYTDHKGTDFFIWPFAWHLIQNDLVEVVAAAAGTIVNKFDGSDHDNCNLENEQWNAVYIVHSDGSMAWYGHMKKNSLTSKPIGSSVAKGEYLGIVASSGFSSGPHLHFEVFENSSPGSAWIDPYEGNCNNLNSSSWWDNQEPYVKPTLNAIFTHSAPPIPWDCPLDDEETNFSNHFGAGTTAYFAAYYRDQQMGQQSTYSIKRSDGSIANSWTHTPPESYVASYWFWSFIIPDTESSGTFTFEVEYEGQTLSHEFEYLGPVSTQDLNSNQIQISPNPFSEKIIIDSNISIDHVELISIDGKNIPISINIISGSQKSELIIKEDIAKGLYLLKINTASGSVVKKLLKK